jgi:hypothetical protein
MKTERHSNIAAWVPTLARVSGLIWSAKAAFAAGGLPDIGLYFKGGLGDDILCSAVAHELKKRGTNRIWHLTRYAELFAGNPDVVTVPADFRMQRFCEIFGVPCIDLSYPEPPKAHLIAEMCARAGISGTVDLRPYVILTEAETAAGRVAQRMPQIAVQTSVAAAPYPMRNKEWIPERFQVVVNELRRDFEIVQLGVPSDPPLRGVLDFRGRTRVREAAGILSASQLFIGLVGGLMHLARAVDCRAVIIYGGREHPSQSGYSANENLYWAGTCAPCWQRNDCDFDRLCMREIRPEQVIEAAYRQAHCYGTLLPVDRAVVPPP